jgi:hypothetical protein
LIDPLCRCFPFLDSVLLDLYPACAEELYSDVVIILCNPSFIPMLYGFVPLETGIARDSRFLGLSRRCRESSFRLRKFGSFHIHGGRFGSWRHRCRNGVVPSPQCIAGLHNAGDGRSVLELVTRPESSVSQRRPTSTIGRRPYILRGCSHTHSRGST